MDGLQSSESLQNGARISEERLARRRIRRWKRRGRIAAPFVGVSILFAALSLSVDLIEYEPITEPARLSDRPMYLEPTDGRDAVSRRVSLTTDSLTSVNSVVPDGQVEMTSNELIEIDLNVQPNGDIEIPTPPRMIR